MRYRAFAPEGPLPREQTSWLRRNTTEANPLRRKNVSRYRRGWDGDEKAGWPDSAADRRDRRASTRPTAVRTDAKWNFRAASGSGNIIFDYICMQRASVTPKVTSCAGADAACPERSRRGRPRAKQGGQLRLTCQFVWGRTPRPSRRTSSTAPQSARVELPNRQTQALAQAPACPSSEGAKDYSPRRKP